MSLRHPELVLTERLHASYTDFILLSAVINLYILSLTSNQTSSFWHLLNPRPPSAGSSCFICFLRRDSGRSDSSGERTESHLHVCVVWSEEVFLFPLVLKLTWITAQQNHIPLWHSKTRLNGDSLEGTGSLFSSSSFFFSSAASLSVNPWETSTRSGLFEASQWLSD